ncbi:MAG TPA: hypothetical protein DEP66_05525 [Acidimicrobiaceae bacterium]|nr:hypothetical protein [Acidimicrobiaceae bacterium]HCB37654.1 hypothetical protein [Acidimicrobiaceae bacterium]
MGHRFADPALLALALSHSSWAYENGGAESNERLEFLGDAVLSVCVVRRLYRIRPAMTEGEMSHVRSEVVSGSTLAAVAAGYGVGDVLRLGRGEDSGGGRTNPRLLEDAFEAVIGAVFLDGGDAAACDLVMRALGDRIAAAIRRA